SRRREGKAHEIGAFRTKCCARNRRHSSVFEHDAAKVFRTHPCIRNVYPGVERPLRGSTAESGNPVQVAYKLLTTAGKLTHHARRSAFAVLQRFDGRMLGELRDAGVAVDRHHLQRRDNSWWSD